jgi:hypothetical protein
MFRGTLPVVRVTSGVLGNYVGTLNMPADTSAFPYRPDWDVGHCLVVCGRQLQRLSFRDYLTNYLAELESLSDERSSDAAAPISQVP